MARGGSDRADGGGGGDTFYIGDQFDSLDNFDGGSGSDTAIFNGDYSGGVTVGPQPAGGTDFGVSNVETIVFKGGHSYIVNFTGDAAGGATLTADGSDLGTADLLAVDFSAATSAGYHVIGGDGADIIVFGDNLSAGDVMEGKAGFDLISLSGDYSDLNALVFTAASLVGIEEIEANGGSYDITTDEANVASGESLIVDGATLASGFELNFDGSAETDGTFFVYGGDGDDTFRGGTGADFFATFNGVDTCVYDSAAQSTSLSHDTISVLDADTDLFDLNVTVSGFDGTLTGDVDAATFDDDIGDAFNDGVTLHANAAWLVHATGGDQMGNDYLVVDTDGDAAYTGGVDYLFEVTGFAGTFQAGDFI